MPPAIKPKPSAPSISPIPKPSRHPNPSCPRRRRHCSRASTNSSSRAREPPREPPSRREAAAEHSPPIPEAPTRFCRSSHASDDVDDPPPPFLVACEAVPEPRITLGEEQHVNF